MIPDLIIVGSGFYGCTVARKFAETFNRKVLIIERRSHFGGNSYSEFEPTTNIEMHNYGTHIFHTNNINVIEFITRFSDFNSYRHTVWSRHNSSMYSMPVNLSTINQIYGTTLSPEEARALIEVEGQEILHTHRNDSLESKAISSVGRKIYEALIKNYTQKQWQTDPSLLPAETISRLPVRFNYDNAYFSDSFQGIPVNGYAGLFQNLLDHPKIELQLGTDFFETEWVKNSSVPIVYTGPIDRYFNYKHGKLSWRTVDFDVEILPMADFQGAAVVNYPDPDIPYTRIHEFKHLHPEREHTHNTVIMKEFSRFAESTDEPYYPINSPSDRQILKEYRLEIANLKNVWFGGRLGSYQYLDMHMAIASALSFFEKEIIPSFTKFN